MMWVPVLVILSLLNSKVIAKENPYEDTHGIYHIDDDYEENESPDYSWNSWKHDHNSYSKYMPMYKDSHRKTRDIESTEDLNMRKIRQAGGMTAMPAVDAMDEVIRPNVHTSMNGDVSATNSMQENIRHNMNTDMSGDASARNSMQENIHINMNKAMSGDVSATNSMNGGTSNNVNTAMSGDVSATNSLNGGPSQNVNTAISGGVSATNSMNVSSSQVDSKPVTTSAPRRDSTLYYSTMAFTPAPGGTERSCSGQRCSSLGGNCVNRGNTSCLEDVCGKRSFLSPCNCDKDHCCCMPVTCPPDASSENFQRCSQAGGYCLYKDEVCDGECLPLCGPSCTCCIAACSEPGKKCGKNNEGSCRLQCDEGNAEVEYPLEKCAGPNCRCCGPKKIEACSEEMFGTPCLNGTGIYKQVCESDESVIEYITPLCKCCAKEACPKAGSLCGEDRGICKQKCDANEMKSQDSICGDGPGCSCCVAKTCTDVGKVCVGSMNRTGECASECKPEHEPIGLCPEHFGLCLCCAPKVCSVSVGSICPSAVGDPSKYNNSVCKPKCDSHEKESGSCPGPSCKCCTSPICEELGRKCSNGRGGCKPLCADNEQIDGTCHGSHCYCCIPKPCDNLWGPCGKGGVCKTQCLTNEKSTPGCSGWNCTCCVPMKCIDHMGPCGHDKKGFCKNSCDAKEILDMSSICNGVDCRCCREKDCHFEGRSCLNGTGKCRSNCLRSEESKEDSFACTGLKCKCCVLKDCIGMDAPCGLGLAGRCKTTCKDGFEDDVGRCEGNKCRCCREKDCKNNGCSCGGKLGGSCKSQCDINEEAISKCEGRDCSCCIKKFCEAFDKPCGGNMNGQCKHTCTETEISVGQCAGLDCKCCALQSCTHLESTCGHSGKGRCRPVCYNSEEVVGICAGTNCSCCQVRMCGDPGSCCNKVSAEGKEISGTCKHRCSEAEEMISQCDGFDCKCCSPMKCLHFGSPCGLDGAKGICKDKCSKEEEVIGKCKGSDCKCCALKVCQNEGSMCRADGNSEVYGKCMHKCQDNEEEIGICAGAHCKCCANKPCEQYGGSCGNDGTCRDRCLSKEEPTGKCKGSHCMCCEPKICPVLGPEGCSPSGGVCRRECAPEDLAPDATPGSCGNKCQCCICKTKTIEAEPTSLEDDTVAPTVAPCVHDGGPCGNNGKCRQNCLPLEVNRGKCRGASCLCCEPYKEAYPPTTTEVPDEPVCTAEVPGSNILTGCTGTCDGGEGHAHGHCTEQCTEDRILPGKCPGENCFCCKVHPDPVDEQSRSLFLSTSGEGPTTKPITSTVTQEMKSITPSTNDMLISGPEIQTGSSTLNENNEIKSFTPVTQNMLTRGPETPTGGSTLSETIDDYGMKEEYSGEYYHAGYGYGEQGYSSEPTDMKEDQHNSKQEIPSMKSANQDPVVPPPYELEPR